MQYRNPVISGCYPDPSICRAGDAYYLVCSSFQFFPGVPLFESRDLINWKQIGHVLTQPSQLPLQGADSVGGIYAPTIRYHQGRFYMVTTNVTNGGHFFVWTDDIYGEWSEPVWVHQEGIDPSLFFEDGKTYFMSNGSDEQGSCILQCEIDPETGEQLTEPRSIWRGTGGRFLESPHLYHIGKYYYLLASEGGTEYGHMVVYARGGSPYGPFEAYAGNPVLTNRNEGGYLLQGCGHADLVEDFSGNWWMVHLGFRQIHRWMMFHITGREVCLVPVTFQPDGWFTAGENGTVRLLMQTDRIPDSVRQECRTHFTFADTEAGKEWVFLQNPHPECCRFSPESVSLQGLEIPLSSESDSPAWIGIRQKETQFRLSVTVGVSAQEAGVTVYMTGRQHYDLCVRKTPDGRCALLRRAQLGTLIHEEPVFQLPDGTKSVSLFIQGEQTEYRFRASAGGREYLLGTLEAKYLSSETAGNFTGVMLALYAVSTGCGTGIRSDFTDFSLVYTPTGQCPAP
ncbi:MAG: glycoside hydrolase family 43 protein [Oscillospiraceae bacterium]|nr:glycoside hydrolase family 43 protein [Oscillospiraceae bacterium]